MKYYVISNGDGDTTVEEISKEELLERIQPGEEGGYYGDVDFLAEIPGADTNYWGDNILIIKGEIVSPTPKEVVKAYEVE